MNVRLLSLILAVLLLAALCTAMPWTWLALVMTVIIIGAMVAGLRLIGVLARQTGGVLIVPYGVVAQMITLAALGIVVVILVAGVECAGALPRAR
jgi:hypothetical protein